MCRCWFLQSPRLPRDSWSHQGNLQVSPICFPYPCDSTCVWQAVSHCRLLRGTLRNAQSSGHRHSEAAGALTSREGIGAIYLFGSVARETQADSSDINLAFNLTSSATERFSLIDQSRIQGQLAAVLGTNVDLIERDYLRPRVSDRAERDIIQIF